MRYLTVFLILLYPCTISSAPGQPLLEKSLVTVHVKSGGHDTVQSGFVVGDGNQVITHGLDALDKPQIHIKSPWNNATLLADDARRSELGLVLLNIPALEGQAVTFTSLSAKVGQLIYSGDYQSNTFSIKKGTVTKLLDWQKKEGLFIQKPVGPIHKLFIHNALVSKNSLGAPVLDECSRVLGIIRAIPEDTELEESTSKELADYALNSPQLADELKTLGVSIQLDDTRCLSLEEQTELKEQEKQDALEKAETAEREKTAIAASKHEKEQELEAAKDKLNEAESKATSAENRLSEAKNKLQEAAQAAELTEQEKARLEGNIEQARVEFEQTQTELRNAENKEKELSSNIQALKRQAEAEKKKNEEDLIRYAAGAGILLLFVILIATILGRKRKVIIKQAESRAAEAEQAAKMAEEEKDRAIAPFDCLLQGKDDSGKRHYLKIDRKVLGQPVGVVLGRNPENSNFIIENEEISRRNTHLFVKDGVLYAEDMDSSNGTQINGRGLAPHTPSVVRNGDVLNVGPVVFKVTLE